MKKILSIVSAVLFLLFLTACSHRAVILSKENDKISWDAAAEEACEENIDDFIKILEAIEENENLV